MRTLPCEGVVVRGIEEVLALSIPVRINPPALNLSLTLSSAFHFISRLRRQLPLKGEAVIQSKWFFLITLLFVIIYSYIPSVYLLAFNTLMEKYNTYYLLKLYY